MHFFALFCSGLEGRSYSSSLGWPGTCYIGQSECEIRDPTAFVSWVLALKGCATMSSLKIPYSAKKSS